eukprot:TRINITY_DN4916_c0_g1_i3.p1 TRINITY_DN4916_c0_g1~~TRINITY_DN4916_c0_g1_i3.p1  ORF type:complete len:371 (+),score=67.79 TRINITY_DN4916_c0_g1_i3:152-1264(+)
MATFALGEPDIQLVNLKGRIFRKQVIKHKEEASSNSKGKKKAETFVNEDDVEMKESSRREKPYYDDECAADASEFQVERDEATKTYKLKFNVPSVFYGRIIGKGGDVRSRIQSDTGATITIPKMNDKSEEIVIKGTTEAAVVSAKTRIDIIIEKAKNSLPYTHFLSIPLNDPALQEKVNALYDDILRTQSFSRGVEPSIMGSPKTFHLTILMLKLFSNEQIEQAKSVLKTAHAKLYDILATRSLILTLEGLEYMNDDPGEVDVLYAKVKQDEAGDKLQQICKHLVSLFSVAGLAPPQELDVKLHATLLNTRFRTQDEDNQSRQTFDASGILSNYGNISLGSYKIPALHLSQRGVYDLNGFYHSVATVAFP